MISCLSQSRKPESSSHHLHPFFSACQNQDCDRDIHEIEVGNRGVRGGWVVGAVDFIVQGHGKIGESQLVGKLCGWYQEQKLSILVILGITGDSTSVILVSQYHHLHQMEHCI